MAEGKITFAVGVEASDAISGLQKIQNEMADMGKTSGKAGADTVDAFKDIDKAAKQSAGAAKDSSSVAKKAIANTSKAQKAAAREALKSQKLAVREAVKTQKAAAREAAKIQKAASREEIKLLKSAAAEASREKLKAEKALQKSIEKARADTAKAAAKAAKVADADQIEGLDGLKESTGELDSSLKGLGGAVGLVSPEMEILLMRTGDLSGGLEAGSRLTTLLGGSMRHLAIAGGTMGVAVAALVVGYKVFGGALSRAEDRMAAAHEEMEKGIKQANTYKFTVLGLKNQIGLLGDAEFAIIDARKKSKDAMAEEVAAQQGVRRSLAELKGDMEGLRQLEQDLIAGEFDHISSLGIQEVQFRDVAKMVKLTNEQIADGKPVLSDNGLAWTGLTGHQIKSGKALEIVRAELSKTESSLKTFGGQVEGTDRRTERLNLLLQLQAAQAREDTKAVRHLALSLAILDDTEARLAVSALRAAKAIAIQQVQMMSLGPAAAAAVAAIEIMFKKLEDRAAPSGFAATMQQLNTKLDDATKATKGVTKASKDMLDVQAELNKQAEEQAKAQADAQAAVSLQVGARQRIVDAHRDATKEQQGFLQDELITFAQFAEKTAEIDKKKSDDLIGHDIAVAQAKLATAGKFNAQIAGLLDASMTSRADAIDKQEAAALAQAEGNAEAQEAIRAKFDEKRKGELGALFKAQQATQIASAIMSGASAGIGALAPPPVGLGPNPLGVAMAALVAATTIAQVGVIASQQPAFHQGGIIGGQGDQAITAQGGEVMLNRGAVASMGGPAAANSLNSGGGGGGAIVVQFMYKQRVLDQLVVDNLAKGGPLKTALNNATRTGRRGRVGGLL